MYIFVNTHTLGYFSKSYQWKPRENKQENEKEGMEKGRERKEGRKKGKKEGGKDGRKGKKGRPLNIL